MEQNSILFRASGVGALMTTKQGAGITPKQLERIDELKYERDNGVNANGNKVKWTDTKISELKELEAKRDAPPELSATAKAFVRRIWLQREKGVYKDIKSKYLDKGNFQEETAISLLSEIDGVLYTKNEERKENEWFSGECDIIKDLGGKKITKDTKCSWDAESFMSAGHDPMYEWQGRVYMELFGSEEHHVCYCLVDCPEHMVQREKDVLKWKYYSGDMSDEELHQLEIMLEPLYKQIETNMVYSNNPRFTKEERVKTFIYHRDDSLMDEMKEMVKLARTYYSTLTLNGKN